MTNSSTESPLMALFEQFTPKKPLASLKYPV
jgi:hypothetical protein